MELGNSKRVLRSASYVLTELSQDEQRHEAERPGRALEKLNFIRHLTFSSSDLQVLEQASQTDGRLRRDLQHVVQINRSLTAQRPEPDAFTTLAPIAAAISTESLITIAKKVHGGALAENHQKLLTDAYESSFRAAPVGRLHLERIEMYPAGIERGELMFTIPLAPKETITVSHKEWSTTADEYEKIVQDYFESYSERGVAEKTDASMSAENETKHSNAFNFQAVASGGYGPVSMTVASGLTSTSENRAALKVSTQRSREVTAKASARTRQEHKVTMKLEKKSGIEDNSFRTITNPDDNKPMRIDFYRMMRKWRTDLYRYGLRLTFDIMVPNPGSRLWALHRQVRDLDKQIRTPFAFPLTIDNLTDVNWSAESAKWGAAIEPPPAKTLALGISKTLDKLDISLEMFDFVAPEGYTLSKNVQGTGSWIGASAIPGMQVPKPGTLNVTPGVLTAGGTFTVITSATGGSTQKSVPVIFLPTETIGLSLVIGATRTEEAFGAWRQKAWTAIRDAAFARHQEQLARLQEQRDRLWSDLTGKDTLTLRRMEREELIRQILIWIFGPVFDISPELYGLEMMRIVNSEQHDLPDGTPGLPPGTPGFPAGTPGSEMSHQITATEWSDLTHFGLLVKFLHHAVEWENLLYFLYPYFWGSDDLAREKLLFDHPDPNHRDFLRSGYARVVVPIRPGFEEEFTTVLDTGGLGSSGSSPYLPIAQEVANFAKTNYAGIPPANPEKHSRPLLYPQQRQTWAIMETVVELLDAHYKANNAYPASLSALPGGPFVDAWGNPLVYRMPGTGNDYDLLSYGADGAEGGVDLNADISAGASASLVASWFEYTPSSGIDIELDTKLENAA